MTAAGLALPALALAARPNSGAFTSTTADVHVAKGGRKVLNADINCKLRGGVTTQAIDFNSSVRVKSSGSFSYRGSALYLTQTSTGYKSRMTVASLSGRFVRSTLVTGTVKGGPGACRSVKFSATFNPRAH